VYTISGGEKMAKIYSGEKIAKLGTEKKPAVVNVQTEERLKEVTSIFEKNGWKYTIGLEPDKPEDIADLEILLNPIKPKIAEKKFGRNEPCPCGSGKKYKKCCGR
jgi:SWIM/SEC-C metal-binding protein